MSVFDRENKIDSQVLMNIGFEYFPIYHETGTEEQYRLVLEARDDIGYHSIKTRILYYDNELKVYQDDFYGFRKFIKYSDINDVMSLETVIEKEKEHLIERIAGTTDHDSAEYNHYKEILVFRHEYIRSGR